MLEMENNLDAVTDSPHYYELQALWQGVQMYREAAPAHVFNNLSDMEVLKAIRTVFGRGLPCVTVAHQIEEDYLAILGALNTVGTPLREPRASTTH